MCELVLELLQNSSCPSLLPSTSPSNNVPTPTPTTTHFTSHASLLIVTSYDFDSWILRLKSSELRVIPIKNASATDRLSIETLVALESSNVVVVVSENLFNSKAYLANLEVLTSSPSSSLKANQPELGMFREVLKRLGKLVGYLVEGELAVEPPSLSDVSFLPSPSRHSHRSHLL